MNYAEAFELEVPEGQGVMCTLNQEGDTQIRWDRGLASEVEHARQAFDNRPRGYVAYRVTEGGKKGEVISDFDPTAEKIILAPPMKGGSQCQSQQPW
jgi:hypothetical protein